MSNSFEWCFGLNQSVNAEVDGAGPDDIFEVIDRKLDEDAQLFTIRRVSDGEVWAEVSPSLLTPFSEA